MSELSILHSRIAALALGTRSEMRELLTDEQRTPQTAFLNEIAETRLYRTLTFRNELGEMLVCSAHSGRLLAVHNDALLDLPDLAEATEEQKTSLIRACTSFLSNARSLTVESKLPENPAAELGIGLTLSSSQLLGTEPSSQTNVLSSFQLERFFETMESLSTALVCIDAGRISKSQGDDPQRANLLALAQEEVSQRTSGVSDPDTQHFVLLSTDQMGLGQAAICAAVADSVLFAAFPSSEMNEVLEQWSKGRNAAA